MAKLRSSAGFFAFPFLVVLQACHGADTNLCAPSSCGEIGNISYPFRLQNDPPNCGNHNFTLYCQNNSTVLYVKKSVRFLVQAINYQNFTILVVDAGVQIHNCSSLPLFPVDNYWEHSIGPYTGLMKRSSDGWPYNKASDGWRNDRILTRTIVFVSCRRRVNSGVYVETASCLPSNYGYPYVIVGSDDRQRSPSASDVMESCRVDMMTLAAGDKVYPNMSYLEIHRQLADGFLLSWYQLYCTNCSQSDCVLDGGNRPACAYKHVSLVLSTLSLMLIVACSLGIVWTFVIVLLISE